MIEIHVLKPKSMELVVSIGDGGVVIVPPPKVLVDLADILDTTPELWPGEGGPAEKELLRYEVDGELVTVPAPENAPQTPISAEIAGHE